MLPCYFYWSLDDPRQPVDLHYAASKFLAGKWSAGSAAARAGVRMGQLIAVAEEIEEKRNRPGTQLVFPFVESE